MDISGISSKLNSNIIDNAKSKMVDGSFENHLKSAMDSNDEKELKKVCKEFEGILLDMMYKSMKATVQKSDLIPRSAGTEIFEEMLDEELVKEASEKNSLGLADMLFKQLSKQLKSAYKSGNGGD
jgi:flagellar protein FlgJ